MQADPVAATLSGAKNTLATATPTTATTVGNPTDAFAQNEFAKGSYKIPHTARKGNPYA